MAASDSARDFLRPFILRETAGAAFVEGRGVRSWAARRGLPEREAMARLLEEDIWPERFRRNFGALSAGAMARLLRSRVFLLGCGGLGGHVAEILARTGVGALRLCDMDVFEESNLNRQRFCVESALGRPKAEVAADGIRDIASHAEVGTVVVRATAENLPELLRGVDAVMDCLDDIPMRRTLEAAALEAGAIFIHGSVLRSEGFALCNAGGSPLIPAIYHDAADEGADPGSGRAGAVMAVAPAGTACLMCSLLIRALTGTPPKPHLFHLDWTVPELERFTP